MKRLSILAAFAAFLAVACDKSESPSATTAPSADKTTAPTAAPTKYAEVDRETFNRMAVRLNLPIHWAIDADKNKAISPNEVRALLFYPTDTKWVEGGAFTKAFEDAYAQIVKASKTDPTASAPADDAARQKLVVRDLDEAAPMLVESDLTKMTAEQKAFVQRMLALSKKVDALFAKTNGSAALASKVPADAASQSLFRRNGGPKCVTPTMERDDACSAIPGAPKVPVDVYPVALQADPKFCDALEKRADAKTLLSPFTVVRGDGAALKAVSFSEAYKDEVGAIAADLKAAAEGIADPKEAPLKAYLEAAAQSFTSNDWTPADEAWAKMNAENSAFYLRVGPDETYWEPCNHKAGFHMSFARMNTASLAWQAKLKPVQQDMENALAGLIGDPYKARNVTFHLPDFIDIIFNAGDDRSPIGGTIGQSLPNWGPVVAGGRGRTVAMSNLYTDPDSLRIRRMKASSLFTKESLALYSDDADAGLLSTILHEATHNLGPAHEYAYQGKKDGEAFGGELASMMEELKAQSGALYFVEFLRKKGVLTDDQAKKGYADSFVWAINHISKGMVTGSGARKPYSQLSAIQIGFLMDEKAIVWDATALAANGTDKGAFAIAFDKVPAAVDKLMKAVGVLKATADRAGAEALAKKYVDGDTVPQKVIAERSLKYPQPSFVYAVDL